MSLLEKLSNVQNELKAPKGNFNSFGKYKYRSAEDILEAVKPVLAKHKAVLTLSDEVIEVGARIYIKAVATFYDSETGEKMEVAALAREAEQKKGMDESQVTGAASSYARKYALNGLFLIDDNKDADATNKHESPTTSQIAYLETLLQNSTLDDQQYETRENSLPKCKNMDQYERAKTFLESHQRDHIETGENYSQSDINKKLHEKGA